MAQWTNWSGETRHQDIKLYAPATRQELIDAVNDARARDLKVRVVGSGHSWCNVGLRTDGEGPDAPVPNEPDNHDEGPFEGGAVILTHGLDRIVDVDKDSDPKTVTIEAGVVLHDANRMLFDDHGLSLLTMGDTDRQTVVGAISTDTHGSGPELHGLAEYVEGIEMVLADGTCRSLEGDELRAARVSLGMLGAIYSVTLRVRERLYLDHFRTIVQLPDDFANLDDHFANSRHVEYWYFPYTDRADLMLRKEIGPVEAPDYKHLDALLRLEGTFLDLIGREKPRLLPVLMRLGTENRDDQERVGPAHTILPLVSQSTVDVIKTHTMEYVCPFEKLAAAFEQLRLSIAEAQRQRAYIGIPIHIRFVKQSTHSYMSPYEWPLTASFSVNFSTRHQGFEIFFREFEQRMLDPVIGGRAHLGKIHFVKPWLPAEFLAVREQLDPDEMFWNPEDIYSPPA